MGLLKFVMIAVLKIRMIILMLLPVSLFLGARTENPVITYLKFTIETQEQGVKYV